MRWWIQPRRGKLPAALPCRSRSWLMQFDLLQDATQTQPRRLALRPYCDWIATRPRWSQLCRNVNRLLSKLTTGSRIVTWFVSLSKGNKEVSLFRERGPALITHQMRRPFRFRTSSAVRGGKKFFPVLSFHSDMHLGGVSRAWTRDRNGFPTYHSKSMWRSAPKTRRDTQNEMVSAAVSWLRSLLLYIPVQQVVRLCSSYIIQRHA